MPKHKRIASFIADIRAVRCFPLFRLGRENFDLLADPTQWVKADGGPIIWTKVDEGLARQGVVADRFR